MGQETGTCFPDVPLCTLKKGKYLICSGFAATGTLIKTIVSILYEGMNFGKIIIIKLFVWLLKKLIITKHHVINFKIY